MPRVLIRNPTRITRFALKMQKAASLDERRGPASERLNSQTGDKCVYRHFLQVLLRTLLTRPVRCFSAGSSGTGLMLFERWQNQALWLDMKPDEREDLLRLDLLRPGKLAWYRR